MDDKLKKLHAQYKDVPIPKELEIMIEKNLQRPHKKKRITRLRKTLQVVRPSLWPKD